ncbi:bifunctional phosphoribosyl-AMP cyclohydrolase/phosphoribosyl-ATP diphosphatase HisIE [Staphylococcus pseudoxylosus]|uniref:bifunctional phosphoribosyl-AMP cyclohydrolase/phosphoribosyl-ATP diphosphatase HisIE n=1 Tax=Staphylococcus pseudoxylosus TaxID=2282419 RepID=UPI000D1D37A3|nr:bifunctional phosphoribosyl-AMP cyclohydrolase/phosphoribosyl-ATP diphosphatase HisIE [Staphylococcus pseudoxylosus]PTI43816.1 bifunctional phosphoribosyl-AMP cyclohydrolase/phosphoribosyl-ATP diphosphatase [Staphylococcus xylosus]MDW8797892.1 bifunctional phosphoribosyl-AMP cyclohydrolase/phosphoribosyl-ATP diphosphatase HisIE [Staphylococcus pseudoxylosus]MEB6036824.1 bifunctional phosphoribosyl-AMP cyclohydrolase/phosphoribosyl-ATP diphosphatase HisIE [Staphylococcus pseudoxylosus]MEB7764
MNTPQPDFSKGLLPAILQDVNTKQVLMLGYMNEAAYQQTLTSGVVCFYSRSKDRLWTKGETSGNTQIIKDIHLDCDQDTLLIDVIPNGPTCHTGSQSCFNTPIPFNVQQLEQTVTTSAKSNKENSYTQYLLNEGLEKITKKFGEESFEVVIGAMKNDREEVTNETADLMYHLFVLLHALDIKFDDVEQVLAQRHQTDNNFKGERTDINHW